jgi:hypothetical protein
VPVDKTWHGRMLGYQRPYAHGLWPIGTVARIVYRDTRTVPWADARLDRPTATGNDTTRERTSECRPAIGRPRTDQVGYLSASACSSSSLLIFERPGMSSCFARS